MQQDSDIAFVWYMQGALMGNPLSQYNIGLMYRDGDGVFINDKEAVEWFTKSAEQDYDEAQYMLGHCYRKGRGVERNDTTAVEWYRRAADNGHKMGPVMDYIMSYLDHHPDEHFSFVSDDTPWGDGPLCRVNGEYTNNDGEDDIEPKEVKTVVEEKKPADQQPAYSKNGKMGPLRIWVIEVLLIALIFFVMYYLFEYPKWLVLGIAVFAILIVSLYMLKMKKKQ